MKTSLRKFLVVVGVVGIGVGSTVPTLSADDIWARRDPRHAFLFHDTNARRVGDLLTVIISENTTANDNEQRALNKSNSGSGEMKGSGNSESSVGPSTSSSFGFNLSNSWNRRFNGSSQFTGSRTFQDLITVTVVDLLPNGNLVVEGYRSRIVLGEERLLKVSGIVRPVDIGTGNSIKSTSMANFRIGYFGKGAQTRTVNQNYLGRLLNRVWPW